MFGDLHQGQVMSFRSLQAGQWLQSFSGLVTGYGQANRNWQTLVTAMS
jgi:hypothetical protein